MKRCLDDVEKDIQRDEEAIEIDIEFALDNDEINKKEYLNLICLIRIAKALRNLSFIKK